MRGTDARIVLLKSKVDRLIELMLVDNLDEVIDQLDHYLLGTLRQCNIDILVFNKVTYYVNNLINTHCPRFTW
jgi:hypothetical protein